MSRQLQSQAVGTMPAPPSRVGEREAALALAAVTPRSGGALLRATTTCGKVPDRWRCYGLAARSRLCAMGSKGARLCEMLGRPAEQADALRTRPTTGTRWGMAAPRLGLALLAALAGASEPRAPAMVVRGGSCMSATHVIRPPASRDALPVARAEPGQGCAALSLRTHARMPVITRARPGVLQVTMDTRVLPEARLEGPLATGEFRREERNFGSGDRSHRHLISRSVGS